MGIRDQELKRLEHYARGLGIKVTWRPYVRGSDTGASWTVDGSAIELCYRPRSSKMSLVLNFLHELAHHMSWVYNGRKQDLHTNNALDLEDERKNSDPLLPKDQRKLIYISERDDAQYREQIYHEVGLKIPKHIFYTDRDLDIWIYFRYYLTGKFPTYKNVKKKKQELLRKYKNGN